MVAAGSLALRMVIAAISGMGAATVCHPLDVIRVQMQTDTGGEYSGTVDCANKIVAKEGLVKGLYAGIGAAYLRQWLYGSCRIGIYAFLLEQAQSNAKAKGTGAIPLHTKMAMGLCSGGIGSFVGTPSELALVRMSADSKLPAHLRRNYKGIGDCLSRILSEEGIKGLWTGATVTVVRAMLLSACVLGIGSEIKQRLTATGAFGAEGKLFHGLPLLFVATLCSSFAANIVSNPVDVVKSRMQNQAKKSTTDNNTHYNGMIDCFGKIIRDEGLTKLWSGFYPAFLKLAPYTIISLILTEKITYVVTGKAAL